MHTRLELYQHVTPLVGLGVYERNFITGEIYWNRVIRSIYDVDESYNPSLEESLNFYKDPGKVSKLMESAVSSGTPANGILEILTPKGISKWVRLFLQAESKDGNCLRIYGTLEDITEQVKMNALLEEKQKLFAMAFDHAPIGMALVSLDGGWIKVNASLCRMLGYTEVEFLKHTFQDFTHPEDLDKDLQLLNQLLQGSIQTYILEKRYFHTGGYIIWALLNVSLVRDEAGVPLYFVSQIKDITERKKNIETIQNQNGRLLSFAHIVSHNLRSHTGNMKILTNMIMEEDDSEERTNLIKMLNENSGNLLETLEHLNEVVNVHANTQIEQLSLNFKQAVLRVLDILAASIKQADAKITVDMSDDLHIQFNAAYLESIIMNLVSNALKYKHPDRQAKVSICAERTEHHTIFQVKDNGQGIDMMLHGHQLFGMYKTFHGHPDARGIGLFLVKSQVEAMDATIAATSEPGFGTTFTIKFK